LIFFHIWKDKNREAHAQHKCQLLILIPIKVLLEQSTTSTRTNFVQHVIVGIPS